MSDEPQGRVRGPIRLSVHGHACVRLEKSGRVLVLDPGSFSEASVLSGADGVLITHHHTDHLERDRLLAELGASPGLEVWAPPDVTEMLLDGRHALVGRVHPVQDGEQLEAAGFAVQVMGALHAQVHPDVPQIANVAYLVDGAVLHPGDSFTLPPHGSEIAVLLLPVSAPWLKLAEVIDYARVVRAHTVVPIHDAILSPTGVSLVDRVAGGLCPGAYLRLQPGEPLAVPS